MIDYSKVSRYTPSTNHSEFLGMKMHAMGDYVLYEDYDELLTAYEKLIGKVGGSAFEEFL